MNVNYIILFDILDRNIYINKIICLNIYNTKKKQYNNIKLEVKTLINKIERGNKLKKIELLAPAGSFEKAKVAFLYGADAVYCGTSSLSLRTRADMRK